MTRLFLRKNLSLFIQKSYFCTMKKNGNILIVDDNRGVLAALQLLLSC